MEESRVDKSAVEVALNYIVQEAGKFTVLELRDFLKQQGLSFGTVEELVDFAERQKVRYFVGRLLDKEGKRKFIATREQVSFDFGNEYIYCKAELIRKESEQEKQSLDWLKKHMIALVRRTPLLPQWAIMEIVKVIERVFERMKTAA